MSAILSECGRYRYRLDRGVNPHSSGPVYAYFGVNPSTAAESVNDATIRKLIGFTAAFGGSRFIVGNPFALRSTDVRELAKVVDPVGPNNTMHLLRIIEDADVLVPCWGNRSKVPPTLRKHFGFLLTLLEWSGKPVKCFGLTNSGDPKHPLMLGYSTELIPFGTRT